MGFSLNVAMIIMSKVLSKVLSMDPNVAFCSHHYVDDIIVDEDNVFVVSVRKHLLSYGLMTKKHNQITDACMLGFCVRKYQNDSLVWGRNNNVSDIDSILMKP